MPLPQAFFDTLPQHHSSEEMQRILEADHKLNHAGRDYDCAFTSYALRLWKTSGGVIFCAPNVMFIVHEQLRNVAEFHSVNGGTAKDLTAGVAQLLFALAPYYNFASTYYDNPRVNDLLRYGGYPYKLTRIDGGEDRTFEARFDLRSN